MTETEIIYQLSKTKRDMFDTVMNIGASLCLAWIYSYHGTVKEEQNDIDILKNQVDRGKYYPDKPTISKPDEILNFQSLKKSPNKSLDVVLVVPRRNVTSLSPESIRRSYICLASSDFMAIPAHMGFIEKATISDFGIRYQQVPIKVDLRECNIDEIMFTKTKTSIPVLPQQESKYVEIKYVFQQIYDLVLVGALSYSLQTCQFQLVPSFMLGTFISRLKDMNLNQLEQTAKGALSSFIDNKSIKSIVNDLNLALPYDYIKSKQSSLKNKKILIFCSILLIVCTRAFFIKRKVTSAWRYVRNLFGGHPVVEEKKQIYARVSDKLKCPCGKTLNIIYQCGHLASCQTCHGEMLVKRCRICGVESPTIVRIFT